MVAFERLVRRLDSRALGHGVLVRVRGAVAAKRGAWP
jgi:hypothetical protein